MNGKKKRTEKMQRRKNRIGYVLFGAFLGILMCAVVGGVGVWLLKEQKMPAEDREEELLEASAGQKPAEGVQPEAAEPDGLETPEQVPKIHGRQTQMRKRQQFSSRKNRRRQKRSFWKNGFRK